MTLRRYAPMRKSRGTTWPYLDARVIVTRDGGRCVAEQAGLLRLAGMMGVALECQGTPVEKDHVRASGGLGMKSRSTYDNGVLLCPPCHRFKTEHGRVARPQLLAYLDRVGALGDALAREIAS